MSSQAVAEVVDQLRIAQGVVYDYGLELMHAPSVSGLHELEAFARTVRKMRRHCRRAADAARLAENFELSKQYWCAETEARRFEKESTRVVTAVRRRLGMAKA